MCATGEELVIWTLLRCLLLSSGRTSIGAFLRFRHHLYKSCIRQPEDNTVVNLHSVGSH